MPDYRLAPQHRFPVPINDALDAYRALLGRGVEPTRLAFISGQVAWTPDEAPVPDDLVDQMRVVGNNARKAVAAVGATMQDVVSARFYVTDLTPERQERLMPQLRAIFDGAQPSLTGTGVAKLAGAGLQVELELVVRVPD